MIPRALSIAGSDSGGGAGIQADLKTFAALGVHGMTVITSVTAQSTVVLTTIHDVPIEVVKGQMDAVIEDMGVDVVKTGMLHTSDVVKLVAEEIKGHNFPLVVDPVMVAKTGTLLMRENAKKALMKDLLPLATVVTPNRAEAENLSEMRIKSLEDAKKVAERIAYTGPKAVVIKGGHAFSREKAIDLLYVDGDFQTFEARRVKTKTTHGSGCCFASAIAAELAKGRSIPNAVGLAKDFVTMAIRSGFLIGRGHGPVNPMARLQNEGEKYQVIKAVEEAIALLEGQTEVSSLIPESQSNLVMALPFADSLEEVAAIPGRIVRVGERVRASSCPTFGASQHVARTVLTAMKHDPSMRAGMNIKHSEELVTACRRLGLWVSSYDRRQEPPHIKSIEGMSTSWGAEEAIRKARRVPDVIYHGGGWGKEPMITLLGRSPVEVASTAVKLAKLHRRGRAS